MAPQPPFHHSLIGVVPHAPGMSGAADRRRLGCWARSRGVHLLTAKPDQSEILVVHPLADLDKWTKWRREGDNRRVVMNVVDYRYLVDALEPGANIKSLARDTGRTFLYSSGMRRVLPPPFSRSLATTLRTADMVVTSSHEHTAYLARHGVTSRHILDCHEEIPLLPVKKERVGNRLRLLWEGKLATLPFLNELAPALRELGRTEGVDLVVCTDRQDFRLANRFLKVTPSMLVPALMALPNVSITVVQWSPDQLERAAQASDAAVLPVDRGDSAAWMKAENRAMIMWRLGLPTIMSATPAYRRVSAEAGVQGVVETASDWLPSLRALLEDDWRTHQATLGSKYVQERHSPSTLHDAWDEVFRAL